MRFKLYYVNAVGEYRVGYYRLCSFATRVEECRRLMQRGMVKGWRIERVSDRVTLAKSL